MNKQAELTRWTPKRLLSLLMALIMTLSLLPTAAFAAEGEDSQTLKLSDFTPMEGRETWHNVSYGPISDSSSTTYELAVHIDPAVSYTPGMEVTVQAKANLRLAPEAKVNTNDQLKVYINGNTKYNESEADATQITYTYSPGSYDITVGQDGSITFKTKIEYSVIENGKAITDSKLVNVRINDLWTGYTVTYDSDGSSLINVPDDNTDKTNKQVYTIPTGATASKVGYTFEGWIVSGSGSSATGVVPSGTTIDGITGDITLKANLVKNQEISFDPVYSGVSGLPYLLKATSTGSTYNIPYTPQLANYTFNGWRVTGGNAQIDPTDPSKVIGIDAPITLTPKWVPADGSTPAGSHKVMFLAGAADAYIPFVATATVANGTDYTIPTDKPTREGYTFEGWSDGTNTYQAGDKITNVTTDIVLSAKWTATPVTIKIVNQSEKLGVTVTPSSHSPSVGQSAYFSVAVPPKYDVAKMFVFAGITDGEHEYLVPESQHIDDKTGNVIFYYKFNVKEGMTHRDKNTDELTTVFAVGPVTVKTFNVTLPTGAGFDAAFVVPAGTVPAGAADNKLTTVNYDGTVSFTVKARPGYTVEGVYANGVKLDPDTSTTDTYTIKNIKSNQAVMVDMAAVQFHTVTYVLDGAQMATQSVANGSNATSLLAPDKTGYNWDKKWYADERYNTEFNFTTEKIIRDTVLYGRYTPDEVTISYDPKGGSWPGGTAPASVTKTYGLAATLTEIIPTKDGCTFLGWSESDTATAASYLPGATFSKEIDRNITLYAVWQKNTYTITFSSGEGYSLHSIGSMTVAHGENFEFNLFVDPAYAQNKPTVYVNTGSIDADKLNPDSVGSDAPTGDGAKVYHYTLKNVTANTAINAEVTTNATYTVTFMTGTDVYQTQQVEFNHKATQPVDPKVEGFTFDGWYKDPGCADADKWNFATPITSDTMLYAKLTPITPKITWVSPATGYTIAVEGTKKDETAPSPLASGNMVVYGSTVTFTIEILDGYDASQMQVGINNVLHAPKSKSEDGKTYTFEFTAKENTNITVVGVERKTVTIIYNANARDDVSGMPEAQTVKYYLDTATAVNDTIINQIPVRTGYKFLGWNKDSKADAADPDYTVEKIEAGTTAKFTENTTLYAVWEAQSTNVTLAITDVAYASITGRVIQYEGESITLQASLNVGAKGTIEFYKAATSGAAGTKIGSTTVNGMTAELSVKVGEYKTTAKNEYYYAIFKSEADEGYADSAKSNEMNVGIFSKAICWVIGDATASELLVYKGNGATGTPITDAMIAGQTYTLKVKTDKITGVETLDSKKPVLGKDYKIVWQYTEVGKNDWKTDGEASDKATYLVTGDKSGYQFRAQIVPLGKDHDSLYLKAAKYTTGGVLEKDQYDVCLYTKPTAATTRQATATALEITGADAENSVTIAGTSVTTGLAQFEGKKVTLTATVTDTTAGTSAVTTGHVDFYRKGATTDTKLNASPIAVGANGVATCEVTISNWDTTKGVTENKDEFYAVYLANATYDTSNSKTTLQAVYIKSTAIKTPIIDSTLPGKLNGADANSTSYEYDLTGLLAGVEHTFKLRTGNDKADWSVVALDGRTVAAKNYTIQWITTTGDNEIVSSVTGSEFKTSDNKVGDEIYVRLNPTGDMKTGADSKKAIIGKKQDVTVAVEASDEIASTPVDRAAKKFPDVYQLNEIELTATVKGHDSETMTPTGTVKFYYKDRQVTPNTFVYLGEATLEKGTDGKMHASIETNKLPVDKDNNTKLDVVVCAAYFGDDTFAASRNVNATTGNIAYAGSTGYVTYDTVTVYSSVVYAGDSENKATTPSTDGITITANGVLKANESSVTLTLGQVYTLDHGNATVGSVDLSKLAYGTDYTVQWQILKNAIQHQDSSSTGSYATTDKWEDLSGQTGTSYTDTMEQDAAYRAKITVKDTPIAKGSFTEVTQTNPGRKVYYSNVLVVGAGMATVTTNITTSANQNFNEEGIVSGETATIHVLASGAAKTTPISTVTATITKSGATEPVFNEKANNVNGYTSFAWDTANLTPGYYTLTVTAESNNGYAPQTITRTLIVRDNAYTLTATKESKVYNGKAQGIDWALTGVDIEDALAQKSVVVYYYDKDGKMVEPTQAGKYQYDLYLPASAYWTELTHVSGTFIIEKRPVEVVDLVAQAKVYDGTNNANIQEIILNDAEVNSTTGLPTDDKGIIDGDSVYAVGTGYTSKDTAGTDATLGVKDVSLKGDDAANYTLSASGYTEVFNIQRSQVKGAIVSGRTYKYTGKDIKLAASDIYLIDQACNQLTDYVVTYYYHNGDGVEKVDAMNKMGKYTVIARPEQDNYKGGATAIVYVGNTDTPGTLDNGAKSSLITISNTVELYGATTGVEAKATKGTATAYYYYNNGTSTDWHTDAPANAGRYLVKATVTNDGVTDTAYGLYTVVKARPALTLTATGATYNSAQYNGTPNGTYNGGTLPADTYFTYTGGTIQGVAYEAPTEAGDYVVTAHVGKTPNYTAHEISTNFTIAQAALTIKADDLQRWQYGSFPDMVASYQGLATGGVAADTSLRDVQIQPEFLFNEQKGGYTNHAYDQVGTYPVTVRNALARNYTVTYVGGTIATTKEEPKAELAIHGMPDNGTATENLVYYGDTIQLYAYGYYKTLNGDGQGSYNTSSLIEWAVSSGAPASIDTNGLLKNNGVGTYTVTMTRGSGSAAISTDISVTAEKQEVKVVVPDQDLIYNGAEQKYDGSKFYAENAKGERITATPYMHDGKVKRTNVGSQIITSRVGDTNATYQSEHYCGLFTVSVKTVSVTPNEISVIYGEALGTPGTPGTPGTLGYSESGTVSGVPALTDGKAVSERDAYINLDVLNGYEILVAGRENENYNVKYVTDQTAPDVEVTAKALTISTGTLNSDGRTSGYLKDNDQFYMNEGFAITGTTFNLLPNDRMYGEFNPVMDYTFAGFVSGDSEADLVTLLPWLVKYSDGTYHNINGNANVAFDKTHHLNGFRAASFMSGMSAYPIDSMLLANSVKNYTLTSAEATQNIYQRPVTLKLREGLTKLTAYKPEILGSSGSVTTEGKAKLLELLLNNLVVDKYNGEGGLAELLKHTIEDLNIQIDTISVSAGKLTLTLKLGNQNYWLDSASSTIEIELVSTKIVPVYSPLDWTSFTVTMYNETKTTPVAISGNVRFFIFQKKDGVELKYSNYKNDTIIRSGLMDPTGRTGEFRATFSRLPAGDYAIFAIAENYTIVE